MTLICLAIIFGLSVAALVGGYRKYMFYRRDTIGSFQLQTWSASLQPPCPYPSFHVLQIVQLNQNYNNCMIALQDWLVQILTDYIQWQIC